MDKLDLDADLSKTSATPGTAGRAWRERLHAALEKHAGLTPEAMLDRMLEQLPNDPVGVFKAIVSTLPKELDVQTQPQQQHLTMLRIVAQAKTRGIDLDALLEAPPVLLTPAEALSASAGVSTPAEVIGSENVDEPMPDFLR